MDKEEAILALLRGVYPNELTLDHLSEFTGYSKGYVTRLVMDLRARGYLTMRWEGKECYCKLFKG